MLQIAKDTGEYLQLTRLLLKHGGSEIAAAIGLADAVTDSDWTPENAGPESLAEDIESMGPAYIKLWQIASTRRDLISPSYVEALSRLQDDVQPVAADLISKIIVDELGVSPNDLFAEFDPEPFACASLGQVHRAILRDGRQVVVKVQRPDVEGESRSQLASLRKLAAVVDTQTDIGAKIRFGTLIDAVDYALTQELDYRKEAANLERLADQLSEFDRLVVPAPMATLVSRRVLVMEHVQGTSLHDISSVVLNDIDTGELATQLVESYLQQTLIDGLFHADPHPGNLLLTHDHKLALIDGGMVISIAPELRRKIGTMLLAIGNREGEEAARIAYEIGYAEKDFEMDRFLPAASRIIAQPGENAHDEMSIGQVVLQLLSVSGEHGLVLPFELILFSKSILQMESTLHRLAPKLGVWQTIRDYSSRLMADRASEFTDAGRLVQRALQSAELTAELPRRLNRITELAAANGLRLKVDAIDEERLIKSVQKVANRITAGLVTSALLVAASLLSRVDTGVQLMGYPLLSTLFFLIGAALSLYLIWLALVRDA